MGKLEDLWLSGKIECPYCGNSTPRLLYFKETDTKLVVLGGKNAHVKTGYCFKCEKYFHVKIPIERMEGW